MGIVTVQVQAAPLREAAASGSFVPASTLARFPPMMTSHLARYGCGFTVKLL